MKRVLSYILISFIIFVNLFAPFSVGLGEKGVEIQKNEARAQNQIDVQVTTWTNSNTIRVNVAIKWESNNIFTKQLVTTEIKDMAGNSIEKQEVPMTNSPSGNNNQEGFVDFTKNINSATKYQVFTIAVQASQSVSNLFSFLPGVPDVPDVSISGEPTPNPLVITTEPAGNTTTLISSGKQTSTNASTMPACSMIGVATLGLLNGTGTFAGCIAQGFYYALFVPSSYLFALAGTFFDYTFAYSVQDTSYRSSFVVQGWGLVRDFCNMFFIFILLYIAIGTILGLHSVKTKEMIINVVIIGLFINFSLFATQVIIDASNVMARVFYNSDSIKITEKGVTGATNVISKIGPDGIIPLSAALVNKVNPQNLIINSKKINQISVNTGSNSLSDKDVVPNMNAGTFILIVMLAAAVNIIGFIVFLSVGLIFITRIIGLWLAMIMAPLAFFTYIVPSLSKTKTIGWEHWWPDTIKLAFLAPVFMFFMYIILKFLQLDLISGITNSASGLNFVIATIVPFAFIMILLMKAKTLATNMSGELGQQITSKIAMAGGLALGAATGGAALLGRGTLGRLGSSLANNASIQEAASKKGITGFGARMLLSGGKKAGSASFDARKTKAGAAFSKETGMDLMGAGSGLGGLIKPNEGGFVKARADKLAERQKRAKDLELSADSKPRLELRAKEVALKQLEDKNSHEIHAIDGKLIGARQRKADAAIGSQAEKDAIAEIADLNAEKTNITAGGKVSKKDKFDNIIKGEYEQNEDGTTKYHTTTGRISEETITSDIEKASKAEKARVEAMTNKDSIIIEADTVKMNAIKEAERIENETVNEAKLAATEARNNATTTKAGAAKGVVDAEDKAKTAELLATNNATPENIAAAKIARSAAGTAADEAAKSIKSTEDAAVAAELKVSTIINKAETARNDAVETAINNRNATVEKSENEVIAATKLVNETGEKAAGSVADGNVAGDKKGRSINDLKYKDVPDAQHRIDKRNNRVRGQFADYIQSDFNKVTNFISSGGVHSSLGADESADKIRLDAKVESSGGGHAAPAHTPAPVHIPTPPISHTTPAGGGGSAHEEHH